MLDVKNGDEYMKLKLIALLGMVILPFSAFAGGEGCNSKKGHGKQEMSVDAQEFKDSHSWMFSESDANVNVPGHEQSKDSGQSAKSPKDDLVEI